MFSNSEYQFELELPENWKGYTANVTSGADEGKILEFRLPTSDPAWSLPTFTALTIALSRNSEWDMNLAKFTTLISVNTGTTNDPAAIKCETDIS